MEDDYPAQLRSDTA